MIAEFMSHGLGFYSCWYTFAIFAGFNFIYINIFGLYLGILSWKISPSYLTALFNFSMVMTEQTLAAVPLFVFMGIMMEQAGLMERLFSAFQ